MLKHVRPDDPVVGVPATNEFGIGPAVPNEIDLLDVFDICSMRPKFFDQRLLVTMVEDVNTKARFFRCNGCAARPDFEAQAVTLDTREDNFFPSHDIRTR